jgi:glycosyltransferase involved in cell wall biosynthesis
MTTSTNETPINMLHVIDNWRVGGAQQLLVDILGILDNAKYNVVVCCLRGPTPLSKDAEAKGLKIVYLNRHKYDPRQLSDVARIIRRNRIRLVHTHLSASSIIGRAAAIICRVPLIVVHDHSGGRLFAQAPRPFRHVLSAADSLLMHSTDKLIAISQAPRDYWVRERRVPPSKVVVIHNGVDIYRFQPDHIDSSQVRRELALDPAAPVVGTVGRLSKQKGIAYFLESLTEVSYRFPEARFMIVGDGPLRAELEENARISGVDNKVVFTGYRSDIPSLLAAMDVFVVPSLWEPFGIVSLEAMAMNKPVIGSRVEGILEVVVPDVTGILVPPADSQALASAIIALLKDPVKRRTLGENGRIRVEESFSIEATAKKIESLYESLCAER